MNVSSSSERWEEFTERTLRQAAAVEQLTGSVRGLNHSLLTVNPIDVGSIGDFAFPNMDSNATAPIPRRHVEDDDAYTARNKIERDLEASMRRREEEHTRSMLEHQQVVKRLQKDHNASEEAFRSIVTHLENQIKVANAEAERNGEHARKILSESRNEFDASCHAQAQRFQTELDQEKHNFETKITAFTNRHEHENQLLKSSVVELTSGLNDTVAELTTLRTQYNRVMEDLETAKQREGFANAELVNAKQEANHAEILKLELSKSIATADTLKAEKSQLSSNLEQKLRHSAKILQGLQSNNKSLQENSAATIASLESDLDQLRLLKEGEIRELKQLVLETKRAACEKVKSTLDEYQHKSQIVEDKITKLQRNNDASAQARVDESKKELAASSATHEEGLRVWKQRESDLLIAIRNLEANSKLKLEKLKRKMEKDNAENQLAMDEQHGLEVERLKKTADQTSKKQKEQSKLVTRDFEALTLIHAKELKAQRDEYERIVSNLRCELIKATCEAEQHQSGLTQFKADQETVLVRYKMEVTELQNTHNANLEQLRSKHQHVMALKNADIQREIKEALSTEGDQHRATANAVAAQHRDFVQNHERRIQELQRALEREAEIMVTKAAQHRTDLEASEGKHGVQISQLCDEHTTKIISLQSELEQVHRGKSNLETKLQQLEVSQKTETSRLSAEFRAKLKRMLPMDVKDDLETTIIALKEQTLVLEMKCSVLQGHIDANKRDASAAYHYTQPTYY